MTPDHQRILVYIVKYEEDPPSKNLTTSYTLLDVARDPATWSLVHGVVVPIPIFHPLS